MEQIYEPTSTFPQSTKDSIDGEELAAGAFFPLATDIKIAT